MKHMMFSFCTAGFMIFLGLHGVASADTVTRFQFTQPNFSGGVGNSLFDVAIVEQRGGAEFLGLQGDELEGTVRKSGLESERFKSLLELDKLDQELKKLEIEQKKNGVNSTKTTQGASATQATDSAPSAQAQTVYNVEKMTTNTVSGVENLYWSNEKDVYGSVLEKNDAKEVDIVEINNSGNVDWQSAEDAITNQIEAGEYNESNTAIGTGYIEQSPTSNQTVVLDGGN